MIRKIGFAIVCLLVTNSYAQDGTVSPYSYFGLGTQRAGTTVENQMMGGVAVYADSIHLNLKNPAAYSKLGMQFGEDFGMTTYTAGMSYKYSELKSFADAQSTAVVNLDYLALGFAIKKGFGVGIGILPSTSVGYNFSEQHGAEGSRILNEYSGNGNLSKAYLSLGYELVKNLSLGVTASYNFGTIDSRTTQSIENEQLGSLEESSSSINGYDLNYALNYTPAVGDSHTLYTSLRVNTQANLSARNTRQSGSFSLLTGQDFEINEEDLRSVGLYETGIKIPTTTSLGLGYGENMKWFLGFEYSFQNMDDYSNDFVMRDNVIYGQASTFALGGFITPNRNSFESYLKRVTYRAGMRLEKSGMTVNGKDINDFGITFGIGLPLGNSLSNLNLGFELGRKGTTAADLIEENYIKLNIGLSLNDQWFKKRKIY